MRTRWTDTLSTIALRLMAAGVIVVLSPLAVTPASAEQQWLLDGLLDTELWDTDSTSALLSRDAGDPAVASRLNLWFAADLHPRLRAVIVGELAGGDAESFDGVDTDLAQAYLRVGLESHDRWHLDVGKMPTPLGNFRNRYLSRLNPLVGHPTGYDVSYPLGVQLSGTAARFDFRAALVDEPLINEHFLPRPDSSLRPAVAIGFTPSTGVRAGLYFTEGAYLADALGPPLPTGTAWDDYDQRIVGLDLHFSRGYLELNADYNRNDYDVPTYTDSFDGYAFFVETKYTFSPRFFAALRLGENEYVKVRPSATWFALKSSFRDIEAGAGYRLGARTILKLSLRETDWLAEAAYPNGRSLSLQLSHGFDVRSWLAPSD